MIDVLQILYHEMCKGEIGKINRCLRIFDHWNPLVD